MLESENNMGYSEYKPTKWEWVKSRFYKWCNILLVWIGIFTVLLILEYLFFKETMHLKIMIAGWAGMFLNDILYQIGFIKPYDREKLEIVYRRDK